MADRAPPTLERESSDDGVSAWRSDSEEDYHKSQRQTMRQTWVQDPTTGQAVPVPDPSDDEVPDDLPALVPVALPPPVSHRGLPSLFLNPTVSSTTTTSTPPGVVMSGAGGVSTVTHPQPTVHSTRTSNKTEEAMVDTLLTIVPHATRHQARRAVLMTLNMDDAVAHLFDMCDADVAAGEAPTYSIPSIAAMGGHDSGYDTDSSTDAVTSNTAHTQDADPLLEHTDRTMLADRWAQPVQGSGRGDAGADVDSGEELRTFASHTGNTYGAVSDDPRYHTPPRDRPRVPATIDDAEREVLGQLLGMGFPLEQANVAAHRYPYSVDDALNHILSGQAEALPAAESSASVTDVPDAPPSALAESRRPGRWSDNPLFAAGAASQQASGDCVVEDLDTVAAERSVAAARSVAPVSPPSPPPAGKVLRVRGARRLCVINKTLVGNQQVKIEVYQEGINRAMRIETTDRTFGRTSILSLSDEEVTLAIQGHPQLALQSAGTERAQHIVTNVLKLGSITSNGVEFKFPLEELLAKQHRSVRPSSPISVGGAGSVDANHSLAAGHSGEPDEFDGAVEAAADASHPAPSTESQQPTNPPTSPIQSSGSSTGSAFSRDRHQVLGKHGLDKPPLGSLPPIAERTHKRTMLSNPYSRFAKSMGTSSSTTTSGSGDLDDDSWMWNSESKAKDDSDDDKLPGAGESKRGWPLRAGAFGTCENPYP